MIRFIFLTLSFVFFAVAIMFVVVDATRSIGVSAVVLTSFAESFELAAPQLLAGLQEWLHVNAPAFVTDLLLAKVLELPTFAVFAALALLFYLIGRQPRPRGLQRLKR
ncbi:MAG: hypothetical protein WAU86_16575 [Oricola sp.]